VALQFEEGEFEELIGEPRDNESDEEGCEEADELVEGAAAGVGDVESDGVEDGLEQDVEDVEAVADASEETEWGEGAEAAGKSGAEDEGYGGGGGQGDSGETDSELSSRDEVERAGVPTGEQVDEDAAEEGRKCPALDEGPLGAAEGECECCTEGESSGVGEEKGVEEVVVDGVGEEWESVDGDAEELGDDEDPETEVQGAATRAGEQQQCRPEEVELLFYGERPEVIKRQGDPALLRETGEDGEVL